jgi:hypothetical protein
MISKNKSPPVCAENVDLGNHAQDGLSRGCVFRVHPSAIYGRGFPHYYFVVANSGTAADRGYQKSGALFMRYSSLFGILGPWP